MKHSCKVLFHFFKTDNVVVIAASRTYCQLRSLQSVRVRGVRVRESERANMNSGERLSLKILLLGQTPLKEAYLSLQLMYGTNWKRNSNSVTHYDDLKEHTKNS